MLLAFILGVGRGDGRVGEGAEKEGRNDLPAPHPDPALVSLLLTLYSIASTSVLPNCKQKGCISPPVFFTDTPKEYYRLRARCREHQSEGT